MISRLASAIVRSKKLAERAEALCVAVGDQVEAEWERHHLAHLQPERAPARPSEPPAAARRRSTSIPPG